MCGYSRFRVSAIIAGASRHHGCLIPQRRAIRRGSLAPGQDVRFQISRYANRVPPASVKHVSVYEARSPLSSPENNRRLRAVENPAVKVILRVFAALAVLSLAVLAILFVLGIVPSELLKEATMKLLGVGAIATASLVVVALILRK